MLSNINLEKYVKSHQIYQEKGSLYHNIDIKDSLPYGRKVLPSVEAGNILIKNLLKKSEPFMVGRLGETELRVIMFGLMNQFPIHNPLRKRRILQNECFNWCEGAGFFPRNVNLIPKFLQIYIDAMKELDILAVWYKLYEDFISDYFAPQAGLCRFLTLNSFFECPGEHLWTEGLKGKKVLVISPFAETIESQYKNREKIYRNPKILPEFELHTIKSVESPIVTGKRGQYKTWFDALEGMYQETQKVDYDVAILGCGAYGFPLAAKIKQSGHMAIHLCGQTQLLFGIKGHRWEQDMYVDTLRKVENEFWTRPGQDEMPRNKNMIEGGCYW